MSEPDNNNGSRLTMAGNVCLCVLFTGMETLGYRPDMKVEHFKNPFKTTSKSAYFRILTIVYNYAKFH
jgi:hypothetical protein